MFLQMSVILFRGGGIPACLAGLALYKQLHCWLVSVGEKGADTPTPLGADTPPGSRHPPMVNVRGIRILLECILVESANPDTNEPLRWRSNHTRIYCRSDNEVTSFHYVNMILEYNK